MTTVGAASGAPWGTLIGFIFLMPLVGAALGAASGALAGRFTDVGIEDQFMKEAAGALQPGTAGLFLLIRKMTTDKVLADLRGVGGKVMRTSFDETQGGGTSLGVTASPNSGLDGDCRLRGVLSSTPATGVSDIKNARCSRRGRSSAHATSSRNIRLKQGL